MHCVYKEVIQVENHRKNYTTATLQRESLKELNLLRVQKGMRSINDVVLYLLKLEKENTK